MTVDILEKFGKGKNMADTLNAKYGRTSAVWNAIWKKLGQRRTGLKQRRVWVAASADPNVDSGSQDTYPVAVSDFAYRVDSGEAFICTVAPAATTDSTFVQLHA